MSNDILMTVYNYNNVAEVEYNLIDYFRKGIH